MCSAAPSRSTPRTIQNCGRGVIVFCATVLRVFQWPKFPTKATDADAARSRQWREIGLGAQILKDLGISSIRLLTSSKRTYVGLGGLALKSWRPSQLKADNDISVARCPENFATNRRPVLRPCAMSASRSWGHGLAIWRLSPLSRFLASRLPHRLLQHRHALRMRAKAPFPWMSSS
jgi:hypothetical protein